VTDVAQHWIDGEWTDSDSVSESINPATAFRLYAPSGDRFAGFQFT
jgi:hypothetical protein